MPVVVKKIYVKKYERKEMCVIKERNRMKELQLSHVWEYQLFDQNELLAINGERIQIIDQGTLNLNSGPDFIDAQIYIDGILMIGDVEIHIKTSDYLKHKHQRDASYNKLILHVVYEEDIQLPFLKCPTVELKGRVPLHYLRNVPRQQNNSIRCKALWNSNTPVLFRTEANKTWVERLHHNAKQNEKALQHFYPFSVKLLYQLMFRVFGQPVNQDIMEVLFEKLPFERMLGRLSVMDWEAILLGCGGFLKQPSEDLYILQLRDRYRILQIRFSLEEIPIALWRFSRMRPANFPPTRLIQLSQLCAMLPNSFELLKLKDVKGAFKWIEELKLPSSLFWQETRILNAYHIKTSAQLLSKQMKSSLFANAFIPYLLALEKDTSRADLIDEIREILESLPAESNRITLQWNGLWPEMRTMADSQMLLAQFKMKCQPQKCLDCLVGVSVCIN